MSIQDCTRSGSGSHDRAVGRKETSGQWHRPLFISAVALRPPSSARIPPFCHFFPPPCPSSSDPFSSPGYFPSFFYPPHGPRLPAPLSPCFVSRSAPPAPPLTAVVLLHASRSEVFSVSPALSQIRVYVAEGVSICLSIQYSNLVWVCTDTQTDWVQHSGVRAMYVLSRGRYDICASSTSTSTPRPGAFRPLHPVSTDSRRSAPRPFLPKLHRSRPRIKHRIPAAFAPLDHAGGLTRSHVWGHPP